MIDIDWKLAPPETLPGWNTDGERYISGLKLKTSAAFELAAVSEFVAVVGIESRRL